MSEFNPTSNFTNISLPQLPNFDIPQIDLPKISITDPHWASEYHKRLIEYVIDFEKSLSDDEEIALKLVSFGESVTLIVEDIGYYNPGLITFYGANASNERIQLVQHVSQLSFLLIAIKTEKPKEERRRIGFRLRHEIEEEQEIERLKAGK